MQGVNAKLARRQDLLRILGAASHGIHTCVGSNHIGKASSRSVTDLCVVP
jgi:hypothetical protein